MSNLQTIARRCPVMGKALAVQTAKFGKNGFASTTALGAVRAYSGNMSTGRARLHTSPSHEARAVDNPLFGHEKGTFPFPLSAC